MAFLCPLLCSRVLWYHKLSCMGCCIFFGLRWRSPPPSTLSLYNMTQWSCSASGSLREMPDSNPGLLPQKSGALPLSHHITLHVVVWWEMLLGVNGVICCAVYRVSGCDERCCWVLWYHEILCRANWATAANGGRGAVETRTMVYTKY